MSHGKPGEYSHHDEAHDLEHKVRTVSRRSFLKGATAGTVGLLGSMGMPHIALGATGTKTLVKIFMRGGADSLSMFPMVNDDNYKRIRPNIKIEPPSANVNSAIALDPKYAKNTNNIYAMNPNLRSLLPLWEAGKLAISPATHFTEGNQSHFDCQVWVEYAQTNPLGGGVFNRYLQGVAGTDPLRAIRAGSNNMATSLVGPIVVPAMDDGFGYKLENSDWCSGSGCLDNQLTANLKSFGATGNAIERQTRVVNQTMVDTIGTVQGAAQGYLPANGAIYADGRNGRPYSNIGRGLQLVAQLLKKGVPVEVAAIDWDGHWDTHENILGTSVTDQNASHARSLKRGADNLMAFWNDIGPELQKSVVVMVGSEFGREAYENGSKGNDHGFGGTWMAFGGPTVGGIFAGLPNVADTTLRIGRHLPLVMNYKDMMAEVMLRHLGVPDSMLPTLFPGHTFTNYQMFTRSV